MEGLHDVRPVSPDGFLAWAEGQEEKHEFIDGVIVMQAGASRDHERVAKRIFVSLLRQVDEEKFDVNKRDFGVRIRDGHGRGSILLPDVMIDLQSEHGKERATTTPIVVVEVLSPSTDLDHHVDKLRNYARLPSLIHYLVFSQDGPEVHVWRKGDKGWPSQPDVLEGMDALIALPEVGASINLAEIYVRVPPRAVDFIDGS